MSNGQGISYFIPPELREKGQQIMNLLSAVDPAQGIMRGMAASGRAADSDLTPEQRKSALIEAGVETASPLMMMGLGALAKQPVKATLMDVLAPTGATKDIAEDVLADPSRRNFLAGAAAAVPVAALAPDVITDVVTKAAKTGSRAPINPINMAMANIRALKGQIDEKYEILDEMPSIESPNAPEVLEAMRIRDDAEVFIDRSETEIFNEVREVLDELDPSFFNTASDDALEEIASYRYDPSFGSTYYSDKIDELPNFKTLVNEAKKRGLHTAKNPKGIDEFPNLRTLVEDYTTDEAFRQAGFNVNPSMQMVRETPSDLTEEMRQMRIRSADRIYKDKVEELREFTDFAEEKIQDIAERARQEELQRKADGGPVGGIGSLSDTARDMYRGPRGIGSYQQFAEGGAATARDKVEIEGLRNAVMMTESGGDPNAVSPDGAIGLMQIMLPTARDPGFGVENAFEIADRLGYVFNDTSDETLKRLLFLPDVNAELGNQYLDAMLNQYSEVDDALRAYNAGKTNVDRFIASGRNLNVLTDEAIQYPIKVTAAMQGFNPKDMNQMEMFRQAPETAVALMEDYPAPPVENRMFSPPPVRPDLPPTFFPSVMPQQRVAEGIETIQPAVPGVIKAQPKKMYQEPEGIATLTTALRPRPRPSQLN